MGSELVLSGLFLHLRRQGLPLSPRDLVDALRALRQGFGLHDRARLLWLCQTLWARSEEEVRQIALLFARFPQPTPQDVETVRNNFLGTKGKSTLGPEAVQAPLGRAKPTTPLRSGPKTAVHFAAAGSNLPEDALYRSPNLTQPIPLAEAEDRHRGTPLLIFGDGGATRGHRNRERMADARLLLERWSRIWHPIVWINPMPRERWKGTSFEKMVGVPSVTCIPLGEAELIRAVDVMRGRR